MKEIIAIINQKGGVAKTTTSASLAKGLQLKGYSVLLVDLDPQGNLSYSMHANNRPLTSLEVLTGTATAQEATVETEQGKLIPSSPNLTIAESILKDTGREYRLKEALEPLKKIYDYIIIDTPPALSILTVNALTVASSVIIPAQADIYSLQGIGQLAQTIDTVKKYCNNGLTIKGLVVTRYNARANLTKELTQMLEETAKALHTKVFNTRIREGVAIKEAQASQQDIFSYAPKSKVAEDYRALVEEVLGGGGGADGLALE